MDFAEMLYHLFAGAKCANEDWNGKGMFIVKMDELKLPSFNTQGTDRKVNDRTAQHIGKDTPLHSRPYIAMKMADDTWQPGWLPSTRDIFGNNWVVV